MKKRILAILLIAVMVMSVLVACKDKGPITAEEAKEIVMQDVKDKGKIPTNVDVHVGEGASGEACYTVYVTVLSKTFTYVVDAQTGEILSITEGGGHKH